MKGTQYFQAFSIRKKLILAMVMTSSLGLVASAAAFFWFGALSARSDLQHEISTITDVVAAHSTAALAFNDGKAASETLQALRMDKRILAAVLSSPPGDVLAKYGDDGSLDILPEQLCLPARTP